MSSGALFLALMFVLVLMHCPPVVQAGSPLPPGCAKWCAQHSGVWEEKCKWTACSQCAQCSQPPAPPPFPTNSSVVNVLVFGDSWGSYGPSWREIQDMFDRHGVRAVVRSAAIGGTQACQWAEGNHIGREGVGSALADAANKLFPELPGNTKSPYPQSLRLSLRCVPRWPRPCLVYTWWQRLC